MTWTSDDLRELGADEVRLASYREDGTLRPYVIIWAVTVGDSLYVRSAYGPENGWFRRALLSGSGRIKTDGLERDVEFTHLTTTDPAHDGIDAAYHAKYDRFAKEIVATVTGPRPAGTTLLLRPVP